MSAEHVGWSDFLERLVVTVAFGMRSQVFGRGCLAWLPSDPDMDIRDSRRFFDVKAMW